MPFKKIHSSVVVSNFDIDCHFSLEIIKKINEATTKEHYEYKLLSIKKVEKVN